MPAIRSRIPRCCDDEGLEAWTVPEVWVMAGPRPDHFVDVTDTFGARWPRCARTTRRPATWTGSTDMLRHWMTTTAQRGELPDGRLAEMFQVVVTG